MQPAHRYLTNLTPLRGFAALWVFIFHFSEIVTKFVADDTSLILTKGYLMVDLFFILSGFIITHVYQSGFRSGVQLTQFRQFFIARFARVYPLHFFTLMIMVILIFKAGIQSPIYDPAAIPTNILLLHSFGIHKIFTWNIPSWSISAEWCAYMAFPFLIYFINRKKKLAVVTMGLFILMAYSAIMFWLPRTSFFDSAASPRYNLDSTYDYGYLRGLAGFISGILIHKLYETGWWRKIFEKDITAAIVMLGAALCMHVGVNDGITLVFLAAIVFAYALNNERLHKICNYRIPQFLGKISYSVYMVQMFIFIPVFTGKVQLPGLTQIKNYHYTPFWNGIIYCLGFLVVLLAIATFTYFTIEKPCRKYLNRKWGKEKMPVYA